MATTPNMGLTKPTPGGDEFTWDELLNACLDLIDAHDHTSGKGARVPVSGINVQADFPFNGNNLTTARSTRFSDQTVPLAGASDLRCLFVVNGELFYRDASGNSIQLTEGGGINIASVGTIGGDYGQPGVTASVTYSDTLKIYSFLQSAGITAAMLASQMQLRHPSGGAQAVTHRAQSGTTAYTLDWPTAGPSIDDQISAWSSAGVGIFKTMSQLWTGTLTGSPTLSGNPTFTGNPSGRGIVPVGAVLATFPHIGGTYNCTATTAADANGFVQCNGQVIADGTSPMNGQTIPNINDNVFLRGNVTSSSTILGADTVTLATGNLPSHSHGASGLSVSGSNSSSSVTGTANSGVNIAHTHGFSGTTNLTNTSITHDHAIGARVNATGFGGNAVALSTATGTLTNISTGTTNVDHVHEFSGTTNASGTLDHSHTLTGTAAAQSWSGSISGSTASVGSGTAFSVVPRYIAARYIMRIK